jgi:hypothetical protein
MVAEVSLGRVGVMMGLEVSRLGAQPRRLARLLKICALSNPRISLDEDRIAHSIFLLTAVF